MNIRAIPAAELSPALVARWAELQQSNATLDSPFFRPEFTQAVEAVRPGVQIAVIEDGGSVAAFFPFQQTPGGDGRPVGSPMNDFQGIVARGCPHLDPRELLRAVGLRAFYFDHLVPCEHCLVPYAWGSADSPYMDLSGGFDVYRVNRVNHKSREIPTAMRRCRKAERELGSVRFELHDDSPEVLDQLICWKREQYRRTGASDLFALPWPAALLEQLMHLKDDGCRVLLSTLYLGDQLAAAHYGLLSHGVLNAWFPVFNIELSRYSPGMILWVKLAQAAQGRGIRRIDLGRGDQRYKAALMSGTVQVYQGSVATTATGRLLRSAYVHARALAHHSRFREPLQRMAQPFFRIRQKLTYR